MTSSQWAAGQVSDYRVQVVGPASVYAGFEADFELHPSATGNATTTWTIDALSAPGVTLGYSIQCGLAECRKDAGGRFTATLQSSVLLRVTIPAGATPGSYSLSLASSAGPLSRTTTIPLRVLAAPPRLAKPGALGFTPIPGISNWATTMDQLGARWCDPAAVYQFGNESEVWYYDGARVFFQLANSTGNRAYEKCALNIARQYRDYVMQNGAAIPGHRVFTQGLRMAWERTADATYRDAILTLAKRSAMSTTTMAASDRLIREMAYFLNAQTDAVRVGGPMTADLERSANYLVGYFDRLFLSRTSEEHQTFMDGLGAEALINYYEITADPRIPPVVRTMLDWLWNNAWNRQSGQMLINPEPLGAKCAWGCQEYNTDLINLIVPAFAWYWAVTGDATYQQRGDEIFSHALDSDISYSGKIFSQNFKWSPSYVRWRSMGAPDSCQYLLTPAVVDVPASGGTATVQVSTTAACQWSMRNVSPFVTVSASAVSGPGTLTLQVGENISYQSRTAALLVGDETIVVRQAAAAVPASVLATGGMSVVMPSTVRGWALGPGIVAGSTPLRIEAHFHNWTPVAGSAFVTASFSGGLGIRWMSGQPAVWCASDDEGPDGGSLAINVQGYSDFVIRCQRDVANNRITGEVWRADGSGYARYTLRITRWLSGLNLTSILLGSNPWETGNASFSLGFLRFYGSVKALGSPPPNQTNEVGDLADYEFESSREDISGNNRQLNLSASVGYGVSPGGSATGSCLATVSPLSWVVPATGGSLGLQVNSGSGCSWTASSNASWVTVSGSTSGSGSSELRIQATENPNTSPRTASLSVNGSIVTITQPGKTVCTYALSPLSIAAAAAGGPVSLQVITGSGCPWSAISSASWVFVTSLPSWSGNPTVTLMVEANTEPKTRIATVTVGGVNAVITQPPALVTTPAGARSLQMPLSQYGSVATGLGERAATTLSLRLEAHFHNWQPSIGSISAPTASAGFGNNFAIRSVAGQSALWCSSWDSGPDGGSVYIPVGTRTSFTVRCQRDVANSRLTGEIWNADGSGYAMYAVRITRWVGSLDLRQIVVGRNSWETPNLACHLGFLRVFGTVKPTGAPAPQFANDIGDIANYEFEGSTADSSGNNRDLVMVAAPQFSATP